MVNSDSLSHWGVYLVYISLSLEKKILKMLAEIHQENCSFLVDHITQEVNVEAKK